MAGSNCNYSIGFRVFSFSRIISLKFINKIVIFKGNHGEDVKECYYYLDSTPTHSYMKALYKYPQNEYPYVWLVEENRRRSRQDPEFELCDTGRRILLHYSIKSEFFFNETGLPSFPQNSSVKEQTFLGCFETFSFRDFFPLEFSIDFKTSIGIFLEPHLQCGLILSSQATKSTF